jgi:hypothetical protein
MRTVVIEWDTHSGQKDRTIYRETDICKACGKPDTDHCHQDPKTKRWAWSACQESIWGRTKAAPGEVRTWTKPPGMP